MQTDRIRLVLRPRHGWEAVDLGFRLARAHARPLWTTWLALVLPLGLGLSLTLRAHPFLAVTLLWWLRPVFDRVPLYVLSRALFGESAGLAETFRALPELLRSGLGTSLFAMRLSPARTFLLPVVQLEGLRGAARRERSAALARRDVGTAAALIAAGGVFHGVLALGAIAGLALIVPDEIAWDVGELFSPLAADAGADPGQVILPLLYLAGISVIEPFLVAGGFALYVNRRIHLEAWDIDLIFRGLARRLPAPARAAAACLAGLLLIPAVAARAAAAEEPCGEDPLRAATCIEAVLEEADFGSRREVEVWVPREFDSESWRPPVPGWLPRLLATGVEVLLWTALAAAVVLIGLVALRRGDREASSVANVPEPSLELFGLALDPESLPVDVVGAARDAWLRGESVRSLSLLYRGALVYLIEQCAMEIPGSATEADCQALVEASQAPALRAAFRGLTEEWIAARYARRRLPAARFEALCAEWSGRLTPGGGPR